MRMEESDARGSGTRLACAPVARLEPLRPQDSAQAAGLLARSFCDNPMSHSVIGGSSRRRLRANRHSMRLLLETGFGCTTMLAARLREPRSSLAGVLIALPPERSVLPAAPALAQLRCVFGQGWRVSVRWAEVAQELGQLRPPEPHWYLVVLGVEPSMQRAGIGSALLRAWLRRVDAEAGCARLETDRHRNLRFYARAGFAPAEHLHVLGQAVWALHRRPTGC